MLEWTKEFIGKFGLVGALVLVILLLVAQNSHLIPGITGSMAADPEVERATAVKLEKHIEQTRKTNRELETINEKLDRNHQTQATGLRIICITQAKTESSRTECAKIQ